MRLLTPLLSLLVPHDCVSCASEGSLLCESCQSGLRPAISCCFRCHQPSAGFITCPRCHGDSALLAVRPAVRYEEAAKDLVWKLKFGRAQAAADVMAAIMSPLLDRLHGSSVVITHVPTATSRVRQRGYDQAALLARAVARQTGLPYRSLLRRHGTHKQVGASRAMRTSQLQGDFHAISTRRIRGSIIVLVDDVVTTGATLDAAASVIEAAGARQVIAITFAQA